MLRQLAITMFLLALLSLIWVVWGVPEMERRRAERERAVSREGTAPRRTAALAPAVPRLSGVVTAGGEPVAEAALSLHWLQALGAESRPVLGEPLGEAESGEGGIYAFDLEREFLPCAARLEARAEGFAVLVTEPFRLDAGGGRLDVALEPELEIEGVVVTEAGEAPRGVVRVQAERDGAPPCSGHTNDDGTFRIGGLSPGRYLLTSASEEWAATGRFEVEAGTRGAVIRVARASVLVGQVVDIETDEPVAVFDVRYDFGDTLCGRDVGAKGRYRIPIAAPGAALPGEIGVEAPGYVPQKRELWLRPTVATLETLFHLFPDRGRNLVVVIAHPDGGEYEGEREAWFRPAKRPKVRIRLDLADDGSARAPDLPGTLEIDLPGLTGYPLVIHEIAGPGRHRVEIERPGTVEIGVAVETLPRDARIASWSLQCRIENKVSLTLGPLSGKREEAQIPPGRWKVHLSPTVSLPGGGDHPDADWWARHTFSATFDLAPGGRVVVELVEGRLVTR